MLYRNIGKDLKVSALGLGCMPMTGLSGATIGTYGTVDQTEALATIHRAIDIGVTFFDTAEMYGPYTNERFLGAAIKGRRDKLVIATKFGFAVDDELRPIGLDGSPANARRVCEASMQRLDVDVIDLFYQHRVDPQIPLEESIGGMSQLVKEGKIRHIGICEVNADTLRKAHAIHPITALQSEYSLWERSVETSVLPVAQELGIGFVPYSPLGRGFLTGGINSRSAISEGDHRVNDARYDDEHFNANLLMLDAIKAVAARHGISLARVALAWLLQKGNNIIPIPGAKRRVTMEDSMAAADVLLSDQDIFELESGLPIGTTAGDRRHRAEPKASSQARA